MTHLIVTDLDGTLLDERYPTSDAAAAIDAVAAQPNVHVALASSKTALEMIALADHCATDPVLVFENGAGLAWRSGAYPSRGALAFEGYEMDCYGDTYPQLRAKLLELRGSDYAFRGFGDMCAAEVAARTGLSERAAADARLRMGSEPIVWEGDAEALDAFRADLERLGLTLTLGGRFLHVTAGASKEDALTRVTALLGNPPALRVIACGDAPNDLALLEAADAALVFPGPAGDYLLPAGLNVLHAAAPGPAAWQEGVVQLLARDAERKAS